MTESGPPYPPDPTAGSNAIGLFVIGESAIGDIPSFDVWKTIISQYSNSPRLTALILALWSALDQTVNVGSFFDNIYNIQTAVGFGLDVWGRILSVSRVLQVAASDYIGFEEALPGSDSFNNGPFYGGGTITNNYPLSDDAYRSLLLTKAAANITDGSIPSLNQILLALFPNRGNAYVQDNGDMTMDYVFSFGLSPLDVAILEQSGVIPHPVGVSVSVISLS